MKPPLFTGRPGLFPTDHILGVSFPPRRIVIRQCAGNGNGLLFLRQQNDIDEPIEYLLRWAVGYRPRIADDIDQVKAERPALYQKLEEVRRQMQAAAK